jgi:hypothetical protein
MQFAISKGNPKRIRTRKLKAVVALIFLMTLLVKISAFAQEANAMIQDKLVSDTKELTEMIDLYFEEMIAFETRLKNTTTQTPEDIAKRQLLEETRLTIIDVLKEIRTPIAEIANNPESLEVSENLKLQYNIALIKASLPRFETVKASILLKVFGTVQPQYVPEIITRTEASQLIFTEFTTNKATRDGMNLDYRLSEMVKTHNAIASQVNAAKNANIHHIYSYSKISTAAQEGALYQAIARGAQYQAPLAKANANPPEEAPSTLKTTGEGNDFYRMITTCFGLFAI